MIQYSYYDPKKWLWNIHTGGFLTSTFFTSPWPIVLKSDSMAWILGTTVFWTPLFWKIIQNYFQVVFPCARCTPWRMKTRIQMEHFFNSVSAGRKSWGSGMDFVLAVSQFWSQRTYIMSQKRFLGQIDHSTIIVLPRIKIPSVGNRSIITGVPYLVRNFCGNAILTAKHLEIKVFVSSNSNFSIEKFAIKKRWQKRRKIANLELRRLKTFWLPNDTNLVATINITKEHRNVREGLLEDMKFDKM